MLRISPPPCCGTCGSRLKRSSTGDASLLPAVTDGQRLQDISDQITSAGRDGPRVASAFTFDGLHLQIVYPGGLQRGANAGLVATGTVVETTYAPDGSVTASTEHAFATTFSMRQTTNGHWLTTDTLAPGE